MLVTDVTEYGDQRCVAGWDLERKTMIRPEPSPAAFWPSDTIGQTASFQRGAIVEFEAAAPVPPTEFPHRTEDIVVNGPVRRLGTPTPQELHQILTQTISANLEDLFQGNIVTQNLKGYVRTGMNCVSLGAIELSPQEVTISADGNRIRCRVPIRGGFIFPTVPSAWARELFRAGGLPALRAALENANRLHLRIGLARGFAALPDRCYVQINDIHVLR